MRPEINKTYRCQNGSHVRIDYVYPDLAYGYTTSGASRRIRYDMRGCPINEHHGFTLAEMLSTPGEPELMFSFAQPGEMCVRTVSETELKRAIEDARRAPYSPRPVNHALLANAAERMIEMAKAPARKPASFTALDPSKPIRGQIEDMLLYVGLNPSRFLTKRPEDSPFNYGPSNQRGDASAVHYTKEPSNVCYKTDEPNSKLIAEQGARDLARMLSDDLNISITPIILRLWLVERWDKVAELAHKIHGSAS